MNNIIFLLGESASGRHCVAESLGRNYGIIVIEADRVTPFDFEDHGITLLVICDHKSIHQLYDMIPQSKANKVIYLAALENVRYLRITIGESERKAREKIAHDRQMSKKYPISPDIIFYNDSMIYNPDDRRAEIDWIADHIYEYILKITKEESIWKNEK